MGHQCSDKKSRILDIATQCFIEQPFQDVKLDDVAEKAGVAKGTIYLYFENKEDLFCECLMSNSLWGERASNIVYGPGTVKERLRALIELQGDVYTVKGPLVQQMFQLGASVSFSTKTIRKIHDYLHHIMELNKKLFQEGIDNGEFGSYFGADQMAVIFIQIFDLRLKSQVFQVRPLNNQEIFESLLKLFGNP